ncbi:MAG: ABC transporter ATP-binding protein [Butyrivibrio sp.]|uniref:ABC transporter ATP-binding protein n=1 Tax=Butyrivibrio sp. TaxID=28121 RepID=UPI001B0BFD08|nr:ABC transporter ATP-binding protein [Butyrivibrio sp.]MBO6242164.1 ABC transporter ATP-binding protein [Butyrivibrio sp.]
MITVEHLTKSYGSTLAVDDLSFTIEDGHIYGFLGPNGAGKSTTLNIMTGCLAATGGTVKIGDKDIFENSREAKKLIGYLPEIPPLYVDQTPREYLDFVAEAKKVAKKDRPAEVERVAKKTNIEHVLDKPIKYLSKGYRQRVGISQALLGNPQIIILDEPTVGLDPMQILEIRELIHKLGENHTVILSSHILSEVQAICDKVLIIYKGKLVAFDTPDNLGKISSHGSAIEIGADISLDMAKEILSSLNGIVSYENIESSDDQNLFKVHVENRDLTEISKEIFKAFAEKDIPLYKLNPVKTNLEDIFLELTSDSEENNITILEEKEIDSSITA